MTVTRVAEVVRLPDSRGRDRAEPPPARAGAAAIAVLTGGLLASAFANGLYDFSAWGVLAALMLVGVVVTALSGRLAFSAPALVVLAGLGLLLGVAAVSMTWADSPGRAWTEVNRIALYAATFAVGCALLRSGLRARAFTAAAAALFGAVALVVLVRLATGDGTAFLDNRLDAPLGYINGTAGLFLMGVWPLVAVGERARPVALGAVCAAGAAVATNLLVLTQSRAVVPALVGSAVLLVALVPGRSARVWLLIVVFAATAAALPWTLDVYASRDPQHPAAAAAGVVRSAALAVALSALAAGLVWAAMLAVSRLRGAAKLRWAPPLLAGVLVVAALAAGLAAIGDPGAELRTQWHRFAANQVDVTMTNRFTEAGGYRYDLWRVAWKEFEQAPLGGVGAGSYGLSYYGLRANPEDVRQPHSLELQMLAELGLGGGIGLLLVLGGVGWGLLRTARREPAVAVAAGGLFVAWLLDTSVDWLWNLPAVTALAMLGAAALVAPSRAQPDAARAPRRRAVAVASIVLVAFAAASLGRAYAADRLQARAAAALPARPADALRDSRRSLALNPDSVDAYVVRAAAYARFGAARLAETTLRAASAREPLNFVPWALLGDLQVRQGRIGAARAAYAHALRLNPRDPALAGLERDPRTALP